jgi:hypothetical protein
LKRSEDLHEYGARLLGEDLGHDDHKGAIAPAGIEGLYAEPAKFIGTDCASG